MTGRGRCLAYTRYSGEGWASAMLRAPCVYILASRRNGTLYVGVTSNLIQRTWQHREGEIKGFIAKYGIKQLVWFEQHETMETAIAREKQIKEWKRAWKVRLIVSENPDWRDLYEGLIGVEAKSGFRLSPE